MCGNSSTSLIDGEFTANDEVDVYKFEVPIAKSGSSNARMRVELNMLTQFDTGYGISDGAAPLSTDQVAARVVSARKAMTGVFNMLPGVHYFSVTKGKNAKTTSGKYQFSIRALLP